MGGTNITMMKTETKVKYINIGLDIRDIPKDTVIGTDIDGDEYMMQLWRRYKCGDKIGNSDN